MASLVLYESLTPQSQTQRCDFGEHEEYFEQNSSAQTVDLKCQRVDTPGLGGGLSTY